MPFVDSQPNPTESHMLALLQSSPGSKVILKTMTKITWLDDKTWKRQAVELLQDHAQEAFMVHWGASFGAAKAMAESAHLKMRVK